MSNDYTIYALRGDQKNPDCGKMLYSSLKGGEGRFAWSYIETADLDKLRDKIEKDGWDSLSEDEQNCYQPFLLELKEDDYVVYINVPKWGQCTLARVKGPYFWKYEGADSDFNHRFPVDLKSVFSFDRNNTLVHPSLITRLKLPGRYWRIYDQQQKFEALIEGLKAGAQSTSHTPETRRALLKKEINPFLAEITKKIHETHPNKSLEDLFEEVFKNVPGVKEVEKRGGPKDHGADLLVIFESGMPFSQQTCVVQVKSFEGKHCETGAVKDIERAFKAYPEATMGLIVSTAFTNSNDLDRAIDDLQSKTGKSVSLLIGENVADFVLRFGG